MQIHKTTQFPLLCSLSIFSFVGTAQAQTFEETISDNDLAPITISAETAVNRSGQSWRTLEAEAPDPAPTEQAENTPPPALNPAAPLKISKDTAVNRETQSWRKANAEAPSPQAQAETTSPAEQNIVISAEEIQALQQEQPTPSQPVAATPDQAQNILPPVSSDEASAGALFEMQEQEAPRAENTATPGQNIVISAEEIQALQQEQTATPQHAAQTPTQMPPLQAEAENTLPPVASDEIMASELQQVVQNRAVEQKKRANAARNKVIKVSKNTPPAQAEINEPLPTVVVESHPRAQPLRENTHRKIKRAANAPLPQQEPLAVIPSDREVHQSKYYLLASAKRGLEKPGDVILIIAHENNEKGLKVEDALLNMGLDHSQIQVVSTKAPLPQKDAVYLYRHS